MWENVHTPCMQHPRLGLNQDPWHCEATTLPAAPLCHPVGHYSKTLIMWHVQNFGGTGLAGFLELVDVIQFNT